MLIKFFDPSPGRLIDRGGNLAGAPTKFCANQQIKRTKFSWTFTFWTLNNTTITYVIINGKQINSTNVNFIKSISSSWSWSESTITNSGAATATFLLSISRGSTFFWLGLTTGFVKFIFLLCKVHIHTTWKIF